MKHCGKTYQSVQDGQRIFELEQRVKELEAALQLISDHHRTDLRMDVMDALDAALEEEQG